MTWHLEPGSGLLRCSSPGHLPPGRQISCHINLVVQIKTKEELAIMRYANQVASAAHVQVRGNLHHGRQPLPDSHQVSGSLDELGLACRLVVHNMQHLQHCS